MTFFDCKILSIQKKVVTLHRFSGKGKGRLAQLVQSICLTSRGSAVRIRQRPQKKYISLNFAMKIAC